MLLPLIPPPSFNAVFHLLSLSVHWKHHAALCSPLFEPFCRLTTGPLSWLLHVRKQTADESSRSSSGQTALGSSAGAQLDWNIYIFSNSKSQKFISPSEVGQSVKELIDLLLPHIITKYALQQTFLSLQECHSLRFYRHIQKNYRETESSLIKLETIHLIFKKLRKKILNKFIFIDFSVYSIVNEVSMMQTVSTILHFTSRTSSDIPPLKSPCPVWHVTTFSQWKNRKTRK